MEGGGGGGESPDGVVINDPVGQGGEDYYDFDAELNDVVCALCGDGGELLCCEGPCLRSYHATIAAGLPSGCRSLGYTEEQVQHFICGSCRNRQHRCASCGMRGSSGGDHPQVFRCNHETCGRFYHALCISAELHPGDHAEAGRCRVRIAAGRPFWCRRPHRPRGIIPAEVEE